MSNRQYWATPFGYRIQKTIATSVSFTGVGLHSGVETTLRLLPADPNHGIVFIRSDLSERLPIMAHVDAVVATDLATTLGRTDHAESRVGTVEHLMAALFALGITNVLVEVDGPEVPILDGSAQPFVEAIWQAGAVLQPFSTKTLRVYRPIRVRTGATVCELLPRDRLRITASIDFTHPRIGLQTFALDLTPAAFRREVSRARTFGFAHEVEYLKSKSLARGASMENVLAFSADDILNPEGPRVEDECVRHKTLDAIGDLALCGSWIEGELVSYRGGHSIHRVLLRALQENRSRWEMLPAEPLPLAVLGEPGPERPYLSAPPPPAMAGGEVPATV